MEEVLNQYKSDVEFRKEYNQMWDSQVDYRRPLAMYQADVSLPVALIAPC